MSYTVFLFSRKEFRRKGSAEQFYQAIEEDGYTLGVKPKDDAIENLNSILTVPQFYGRWRKVNQKNADNILDKNKELSNLVLNTDDDRKLDFNALTDPGKYKVVHLNRLLLEQTYPGLCPKYSWKVFWEWVESILIALVLAVLIRSYFVQPFKIPSGSMRMTLIEGDHLFVDKWTYGPQLLPPMFWDIRFHEESRMRADEPLPPPLLSLRWPEALLPMTKRRLPGFRKPQRGDIIVFVYPVDPTKDFIKRLIAVGGETVEIKDGVVYIDGKEITDPRIKRTYYYNRGDYGAEGQTVHVPPGFCFVMGDNSGSSYDSRYWGFVPESSIIGKADIIFWPLDRIRIIR